MQIARLVKLKCLSRKTTDSKVKSTKVLCLPKSFASVVNDKQSSCCLVID